MPDPYVRLTHARDPGAMRRVSLIILTAIALLSGAGCRLDRPAGQPGDDPAATGQPAAPPPGSSTQSVTAGGIDRTYRVYRPAALGLDEPVALVLMMHGGFGTAEQAESAYGWDAAAERYGFVVAYPDGLNRAWAVGGGCCGEPGRQGTDDVGFIRSVVADLSTRLPVDADRVFATGMSNGAMMSYRLACDSDLFAAIAPVAGTLMGECPSPRPVSLLHIHGLADESVPFDGSPGTGRAQIDGAAVPATVDIWRQADSCEPAVTRTEGLVVTSRSACRDGRTVILITVAGAGHQWPGGAERTLVQQALGMDPPSNALDATTTIWQFFASHTRP
jgi:polyhydroxybutyrate depolymerase